MSAFHRDRDTKMKIHIVIVKFPLTCSPLELKKYIRRYTPYGQIARAGIANAIVCIHG